MEANTTTYMDTGKVALPRDTQDMEPHGSQYNDQPHHSSLHTFVEHDDACRVLLPHHLPEVATRVLKWALQTKHSEYLQARSIDPFQMLQITCMM